MKQVGKLFKIWWSEEWNFQGAGNTENQDFELRNNKHSDSFHRSKRTGTHWDGLNIFLYAKIQWAQTMAITCIWCNYFNDKKPFP